MLNPVAKKWVEALRSGEYKQGKNNLRRGDEFCCLGVACDLAARETVISKVEIDAIGTTTYEGHTISLPDDVRKWLGVRGQMGDYKKDETDSNLADDNDRGKTFTEIADIIESEPDGLFV